MKGMVSGHRNVHGQVKVQSPKMNPSTGLHSPQACSQPAWPGPAVSREHSGHVQHPQQMAGKALGSGSGGAGGAATASEGRHNHFQFFEVSEDERAAQDERLRRMRRRGVECFKDWVRLKEVEKILIRKHLPQGMVRGLSISISFSVNESTTILPSNILCRWPLCAALLEALVFVDSLSL